MTLIYLPHVFLMKMALTGFTTPALEERWRNEFFSLGWPPAEMASISKKTPGLC